MVGFIPKTIEKRVTMIVAALLSGLAFLLVGPSLLLNFPDTLLTMAFGHALVGIFLAYTLIPALPEMVESALPLYPGHEGLVNDLSAGIFAAFFGIGQMLAPTFGSFVTAAYSFRFTCDIMAMVTFTFGIMYFLLGGGLGAFRKTWQNLRGVTDI